MNKIKTIIVACGSGIATSATCATRINMELEKRGLEHQAVAEPVGLGGLEKALEQADVYVCIIPLRKGLKQKVYNVPTVNGIGLLTGLQKEECIDNIVKALNL